MSLAIADGLVLVRSRARENQSLATLITTSPDSADPQVSIVNAAVISHPVTGLDVVALVGRTGAKLTNLRVSPRATLVFQAGWEWVALKGPAELSGPDDANPSIDAKTQRDLLRLIYTAAGGQHQSLEEYDRVMRVERRCAVLVEPERIWTNPTGSEHLEPGTTP